MRRRTTVTGISFDLADLDHGDCKNVRAVKEDC
jgi:hypothetical protein